MGKPVPINDDLLEQIVDLINSQINIPVLNEKTERAIFKAILLALFQLLGSEAVKSMVIQKKSV